MIANRISRRGIALAILVATFIALSAAYSFAIPVFEAPDEAGHVDKINFFLTNHTLPNLRVYSFSVLPEPPLYHACAAFVLYLISNRPIMLPVRWNPQPGRRALYTHSAAESNYSSIQVQDFHVLRLFSVFLGAITLVITYSIGMAVLGGRKDLALLAAATNAFIPQFTFMSGVISYDVMISLFSGLSIFLAVRLVEAVESSRKETVYNAVASAASVLTKYTGLYTVALAVGALVARERWSKTNGKQALLVNVAILLITVAVLAGWFFVQNEVLYGTPIVFWFPANHPGKLAFLPKLTSKYVSNIAFFKLLFQSFWLYFGWMNIRAPAWVYWFLAILSVVAVIGIILTLKEALRCDKTNFLRLMVCAGAVLLVSCEAFAYNLVTYQPQGRFMFPAISAVAVLLTGGLANCSQRLTKDRRVLPALLIGFLLAVNIWALQYIPQVYGPLWFQ